jgi:glycosyltransferase involved in cell wall biosynthesis
MSLSQNIKKTINYSRKNGYSETFLAAWERVTAKYHADYKYVTPDINTLEAQRNDKGVSDIKFSILVPSYETDTIYMEALIESCLAQTYEDWELIISDGSTSDIVKDAVMKYSDSRIKYIRLGENGGISENTNVAIEAATGDYCGLLDHDDLITPDALYEIAHAIDGKYPIFAYTDEDKCDSEGKNFYDPHFKLDFNLDLLLTNNYVCHFTVIKTELLKKLKIRKEYDGSQDYDLILRIASHILIKEKESTEAKPIEEVAVHVPKVLYHWRCHENSTADNPQSKMYAYEAGKKALIDFTQRMGWKADVRHNKHLGFYRIEYRNGVLNHRPDLAAVGGLVSKYGKVASGIYKGQPVFYAGYMNRMDLYQNTDILDIRNLAVNKSYISVYEEVTGHTYENTFAMEQKVLPQWIKDLGRDEIIELNQKLSKALSSDGARLLLDPVCVRKM